MKTGFATCLLEALSNILPFRLCGTAGGLSGIDHIELFLPTEFSVLFWCTAVGHWRRVG